MYVLVCTWKFFKLNIKHRSKPIHCVLFRPSEAQKRSCLSVIKFQQLVRFVSVSIALVCDLFKLTCIDKLFKFYIIRNCRTVLATNAVGIPNLVKWGLMSDECFIGCSNFIDLHILLHSMTFLCIFTLFTIFYWGYFH